MSLVRSWELIAFGGGWEWGTCERKWSPGQPIFLNYVSGDFVVPLTKAGNLEKGVVLCVKLMHNENTFGHFHLGHIKVKTLGKKGD